MKKEDKFTELCSGYVLNALDEQEEKEFQKLLAKADDDQLKILDDMKAVAAEMATLTSGGSPSPAVKDQIMAVTEEYQEREPKQAPVRKLTWYKMAAAASIFFVLTSLGLALYNLSLQEDIQSQQGLISEQQTTIERLETEVQRKEELLTILEAREVDLVVMDGTEDMNPNGYGKVVWDKQSGQALLQVANLPSVPVDKDYQLWFIANGQPISAGVFAVQDPQRDNFFKIEQLQSSANEGAFAITMEPKGGVPQPTGDMYLLGNMQ
ncbi:anti-sigma factor domain-containing protein [Gracilimonas sp.]|uniref:anti-sigma factor n=1 Tax=Gracilimonas sp. TaxID=1974203 RepID=UPI0028711221|nr:anti-sigma factor [Gracilimonas sp.]